MINKITDSNQFNSESWQLKINSLFHLFIHKTNDESFLFEFKEWKFLSYKTHFSFMSNFVDLGINEAFLKVGQLFKNNKNWELDANTFAIMQNETIAYFSKNNLNFTSMNHEPSDQLLLDAIEHIKNHELNDAYKILVKAKILFPPNIHVLLLLVELGIILNKKEDIPGYLIALIPEKESGNLNSDQSIKFQELLSRYQRMEK